MTNARYAVRQMLRQPAFSAAVILMLALGSGASALVFSVIKSVLLEPLPYPDSRRIVRLFERNEQFDRMNPSDPNFADFAAQSRAFAATAQASSAIASVAGGSEPVRVPVANVSRGFYEVLGVQPLLGRTFAPEEQRIGAAPVALVSYRYWQRYLGGAADFTSRSLRIDERLYSIVGVMPPGFDYPGNADVWTPRELWPVLQSRSAHNWMAVARLAPGVSAARARDDVSAIARRIHAEIGEGQGNIMTDATAVPLHEIVVGNVRPALYALSAAVALVFLVACANVTGLLLARAVSREQELAVRVALGAAQGRLTRELFGEALTLCAAGGALGLLAAWAGLRAIGALHAGALPRAETIDIDLPTVVFTTGIVLLTAAGLSCAVAWRAYGDGMLRGANRRAAANPRQSRTRALLVAAQVAMTLVLLVGSLLLGRSFLELTRVDPGFRTTGTLFMHLSVPRPAFEMGDDGGVALDAAALRSAAAFYGELIERLRAVPGIDAVGGVSAPPLTGGAGDGQFLELLRADEIRTFAEFSAFDDPAREGYAEFRVASEDYFTVMGIPLLRGRLFEPGDGPDRMHVAVISRSLAERRWPNEEPLGKLIEFGNMDGDLTPFTIVGVVGDVREYGIDTEPRPTFYAYYRQRPYQAADFSIAIPAPFAERLMPAVRAVVRELDPDIPPEFQTAEELYARSLAQRRFNLAMLGVFGGATLLLALCGIYSAMAFAVARRTHEIGVRLALGARAATVVWLVVGNGLLTVGIGVAAGLVASLAAARLVAALLYGVSPYDAAAYVSAAVAVLVAGAAASWLPASRAARVDPLASLRQE